MRGRLKALTGLSIFLLCISGVTAQDLPDLTDEQIEEFETINEDNEIDIDTVAYTFDNSTRLVKYDFNTVNGTRFLFYSDIPREIEVYDINAFSEKGLEELPIKRYRISEGYTEVLTDVTSQRGDRSAFMIVGDNYATISNSRTSELIGTPDSAWGFILGVGGGGMIIFGLLVGFIRYKQRRVDKNGVRRR